VILLEHKDFIIQLAHGEGHRDNSSLLIKRMYSWRGYDHEAGESAKPTSEVTFQACRGPAVFGTVTLCLDGPAGLLADELYKSEIDGYRSRGGKVCELTRLAVDAQHGSKHVLGALFHLTYVHGALLERATDVFIEVNPRHVSFYEHMLHFHQVGEYKRCGRVNAMAALLHLEVAHVREQISARGTDRQSHKSLYPYFLCAEQEMALAQHMISVRYQDIVRRARTDTQRASAAAWREGAASKEHSSHHTRAPLGPTAPL
jgi:hypothetical protein